MPENNPSSKSPTYMLSYTQRILHVGGRTNSQSYVEFGSVQAVKAMINHVIRDLEFPTRSDAKMNDLLEKAFWSFDAARKGISGTRLDERLAFKQVLHSSLLEAAKSHLFLPINPE